MGGEVILLGVLLLLLLLVGAVLGAFDNED
jgi:hypothetical protein